MSNLVSNEASSTDDINADEVLVLIFLTEYHALQQALVRAGFTKTRRIPGKNQPDWRRFALHIERKFQPDPSSELMEAVVYLLAQTDRLALRWERLQDAILGEPPSPQSDILWLSELVQEIGNKVHHWINFMETPGFAMADVLAALLVVEAWSYIDPKVESLLASVH